MEKELFRAIIAENQEYIGRIPLVQRPLDLEEYGNYVFVGVRQAGKSYLLYQRIQQLLANGVDIENIVYVNFDDERLQGMSVTDFDLILQSEQGRQPLHTRQCNQGKEPSVVYLDLFYMPYLSCILIQRYIK